jgi:hypothetical protein
MAIPERRFYQAVLWLPLLLPVLAGIFLLPHTGYDTKAGSLSSALGLSLLFGGGPYALFAVALLWQGRHWSTIHMRDMAWRLPVWFGLFAALANGLLFGLFGLVAPWNIGIGQSTQALPVFGDIDLVFYASVFYASISLLFSLVMGYGYVVLIFIIRWLLSSVGLLAVEEPPPGSPRRTRRIIG